MAEPTPHATAGQIQREIWRRKNKNKHGEEITSLNIIAMMDMMTIILVFLLKTLSNSSANIPQSDDLRVPRSSSRVDPSGSLQVIVSRVSITVNGRAIGVYLRDGLVDPSQKRGGSAGFLINPLASEMRNQAEVARALAARTGQPFRGEVAIIAHRDIPLRTIYESLYTCAQNGFSNFQLLVLKGGGAAGS